MRTLYRLLPAFLLLWGVTLWFGFPAMAYVSPPSGLPSLLDKKLEELTAGQLMLLFANMGLGVMVFIVWYFDSKRQTSLEALIGQYSKSADAHLAAFKDINERNTSAFQEVMAAFRDQARDSRDVILTCVRSMSEVMEQIKEVRRQMEKKP